MGELAVEHAIQYPLLGPIISTNRVICWPHPPDRSCTGPTAGKVSWATVSVADFSPPLNIYCLKGNKKDDCLYTVKHPINAPFQ